MHSFNVTIVKVKDYPHALALQEAAEYIHWSLLWNGYTSSFTYNYVAPDAHNIVFCAHMLGEGDLENAPADTIIFNSEQLELWRFREPYRRFLDKFYVWDYSLKNLPLIGHDRAAFIPFLFCPDLVRQNIPRIRGTALSFYGWMTPRREKLIDELKAANVVVHTGVGKYTKERDLEMFKSWAVLNLRQRDEVPTFEPLRCFYPLTNGIPVISEAAPDDPTFDIYKDWIFAFETKDLARETAALYADPESFLRRAKEKVASFHATSGIQVIAGAVETYLKSLR